MSKRPPLQIHCTFSPEHTHKEVHGASCYFVPHRLYALLVNSSTLLLWILTSFVDVRSQLLWPSYVDWRRIVPHEYIKTLVLDCGCWDIMDWAHIVTQPLISKRYKKKTKENTLMSRKESKFLKQARDKNWQSSRFAKGQHRYEGKCLTWFINMKMQIEITVRYFLTRDSITFIRKWKMADATKDAEGNALVPRFYINVFTIAKSENQPTFPLD